MDCVKGLLSNVILLLLWFIKISIEILFDELIFILVTCFSYFKRKALLVTFSNKLKWIRVFCGVKLFNVHRNIFFLCRLSTNAVTFPYLSIQIRILQSHKISISPEFSLHNKVIRLLPFLLKDIRSILKVLSNIFWQPCM